MTFDEWWNSRKDGWPVHTDFGYSLAAWSASAARYAPLVEACEAMLDYLPADNPLKDALAAVKETI